ncbi:hypothetical protein EDD41_2972 [Luteococcus japonicus]|uniref:Uncharacterized protein n=1 Tax=Luteococcus japonicus TaxID=33984 RepID=A0A3N1ZZT6_9ACTN|nr:hypothetical protein EDD41_2972 [Luteococcus japonicus]
MSFSEAVMPVSNRLDQQVTSEIDVPTERLSRRNRMHVWTPMCAGAAQADDYMQLYFRSRFAHKCFIGSRRFHRVA